MRSIWNYPNNDRQGHNCFPKTTHLCWGIPGFFPLFMHRKKISKMIKSLISLLGLEIICSKCQTVFLNTFIVLKLQKHFVRRVSIYLWEKVTFINDIKFFWSNVNTRRKREPIIKTNTHYRIPSWIQRATFVHFLHLNDLTWIRFVSFYTCK